MSEKNRATIDKTYIDKIAELEFERCKNPNGFIFKNEKFSYHKKLEKHSDEQIAFIINEQIKTGFLVTNVFIPKVYDKSFNYERAFKDIDNENYLKKIEPLNTLIYNAEISNVKNICDLLELYIKQFQKSDEKLNIHLDKLLYSELCEAFGGHKITNYKGHKIIVR